MGALYSAVSGLLALVSRAYPQFLSPVSRNMFTVMMYSVYIQIIHILNMHNNIIYIYNLTINIYIYIHVYTQHTMCIMYYQE